MPQSSSQSYFSLTSTIREGNKVKRKAPAAWLPDYEEKYPKTFSRVWRYANENNDTFISTFLRSPTSSN